LFGQGNEMTQTGTQMGTPIFMSPEQVKADKSIDHRSDIYSLGVTLFTMLAGRTPYDGDTTSQFDIFTKIVHEPLPELESTSYLADLVRKACQKDREQRFQSCEEWIEDLKQGVAPKVESLVGEKTVLSASSSDKTVVEKAYSDKTLEENNSNDDFKNQNELKRSANQQLHVNRKPSGAGIASLVLVFMASLPMFFLDIFFLPLFVNITASLIFAFVFRLSLIKDKNKEDHDIHFTLKIIFGILCLMYLFWTFTLSSFLSHVVGVEIVFLFILITIISAIITGILSLYDKTHSINKFTGGIGVILGIILLFLCYIKFSPYLP
jgi:serine/threonine protein kinase